MATKSIPDGFVLLASYDERVGDEHQKTGPQGDYMRALRELSKKSPRIRGYKDCGQWVVCEKDVKEFLADVRHQEQPTRKKPRKQVPDCVGLDQRQADVLFGFLNRIAEALENFATRPESFKSSDEDAFMSHS